MAVLSTLFQILLLFLSVIMIILVLLQRGRGGGLAGAFGGMGGQSAFGTKAGDVFTKITVVVAILWVLSAGLMGLTARAAQNSKSKAFLNSGADADATGSELDKTGTIPPAATAPAKDAAPPATGTGTTPPIELDARPTDSGLKASETPPPATTSTVAPPATDTPAAPPEVKAPAAPAADAPVPTDPAKPATENNP